MMHLWGIWIEGAWIVMESFMDSWRPMQLLNSLVVVSLVALYTLWRGSGVGKLFALWTVSAGSILLWVTCTILLHKAGM
jgi:hypothetical protein